ncbi:MAG: DUF4783 domain-containing protein [Bernardetiaceae bacterium]
MKIFSSLIGLLLMGLFLLFPGVYSPAQEARPLPNDIVENIRLAIKSGSANELSRYLHDPVELNLDEKRESYSRNQAEFILRDFFNKYKVNDFSYVHQGSSKEGLQYVIGKYDHDGGAFQVYMLLKKKENSQEMRVSMVDFSEDQ